MLRLLGGTPSVGVPITKDVSIPKTLLQDVMAITRTMKNKVPQGGEPLLFCQCDTISGSKKGRPSSVKGRAKTDVLPVMMSRMGKSLLVGDYWVFLDNADPQALQLANKGEPTPTMSSNSNDLWHTLNKILAKGKHV